MNHRILRSLIGSLVLIAVISSWAPPAEAQKFYPDDPVWKEPPPVDTVEPQMIALSGTLEWFTNQFTRPGERHPDEGVIPALNANTLGEVPDSAWFTNRHGRDRMTLDELVAGPGGDLAPSIGEPWRVLTVKPYGDRTGILIADSRDILYLLRFDPKNHIELNTGTQMVSPRFYYAAGYNVLESYLVYFDRERLVVHPGAEQITSFGELRDLEGRDIDNFLKRVARDPERGYRAVATRVPRRQLLGNWRFHGTRSDDPNDIVPHEHRRDLRGMWVLHAWLNNFEFTPANTLAVAMTDGPGQPQYVRRFVVDFFKTLGAGPNRPKEARDGNEYRFELNQALKNVAGIGLTTPWWAKESYPRIRGLGRFGGDAFVADKWTADTHFVTWANRLPDDLYWGAKLVMSFTDEEIRAIVNTGGYSDPRTTEYLADALIKRRDKIGQAFFSHVLPLDNFKIEDGRLSFDDLMEVYGFAGPRQLEAVWYEFDNITENSRFIDFDRDDQFAVPGEVLSAAAGSYYSIGIQGDTPGKSVIVYIRTEADGPRVVGVERNWPGKVLVEPETEVTAGVSFSRFAGLEPELQELLAGPAQAYNEVTGRNLTTQQWFDQLTLSERTTFDAVTHALMSTRLSDENGEDLGRAFDLIAGLERIAGQYSGRGGDQQFRLYVDLEPDAVDKLERSTQFFSGHENTVYHVGYPHSYRQEGEVPNMQVSVSEDGLRADIDVDYRSSKSPQALFNGHLTSSNSDVRAGDNHDRHTGRWQGLANWWQEVLGNIGLRKAASRDLLSGIMMDLPTPLPPDRPLGAAPAELYEAAQEFFTDWLVREKNDEAMHFFSSRVIACINIDEDAESELLSVADAIVEMRAIMEAALEQLPHRDNLTEAIAAIEAQNEDMASRVESHPFEREFMILQVRNNVAADFMCSTKRGMDPPEMPGGPDALGTYWGVLVRFKARDEMGGTLGFLWDKLEGQWKISSYDLISF